MEKTILKVGEQYELPTVQSIEVQAGDPTVLVTLYVLAEQQAVVPVAIPFHWEKAQELSLKLKAAIDRYADRRRLS